MLLHPLQRRTLPDHKRLGAGLRLQTRLAELVIRLESCILQDTLNRESQLLGTHGFGEVIRRASMYSINCVFHCAVSGQYDDRTGVAQHRQLSETISIGKAHIGDDQIRFVLAQILPGIAHAVYTGNAMAHSLQLMH